MVVNKIKNYFLKDKKEFLAISFVVILSLFLRLYRIADYMTFLGDEGRDALVWLRMSRGKFTLIGPQTSVGNMYLGPLYYYLMFPFYLLLGTVGPSIGTALFSGATTFLLFFFGKRWFSSRAGLLSAFFYAISPIAIIFGRTSWNPNVLPFFSILIYWAIWRFWKEKDYFWLFLLGIFVSFAVQSHYLASTLLILGSLFWLNELIYLLKTKQKKQFKSFLTFSLLSGFAFIFLTIVPLVWFDLRHNFINTTAFQKFFSERSAIKFNLFSSSSKIIPLWQLLVTRILAAKQQFLGQFLSLIILVFWLSQTFNQFLKGNKSISQKYSFFLFSLIFGLFFASFYQQSIYDHYLGFLFPITLLIFGEFFDCLIRLKFIGRVIVILFFSILVYFQIKESPLKDPPGYQLKHTQEVAAKILEESESMPYNLGMIAPKNYDSGYRYFLEKWNKKPVEINPQHPETITDQLFVICEEECQPTTSPQAEIAFFGWSKVEKEWNFPWGVKLYKLVHY